MNKKAIIIVLVTVVAFLLFFAVVVALAVGLGVGLSNRSSNDNNGGSNNNGGNNNNGGGGTGEYDTAVLNTADFNKRFVAPPSGSGSAVTALWTTGVGNKASSTDTGPPPSSSNSTSSSDPNEIRIYAARQEFEPFQISLLGNGNTVITCNNFTTVSPSGSVACNMFLGLYDSNTNLVDQLSPRPNPATISLSSTPALVYFLIYVPNDAIAGDHYTTVSIDSATTITIRLTVFNFAIPLAASLKSQMNSAMSEPQHSLKQLLFDYRHSPVTVPWPTGFGYGITWDNSDSRAAQNRCKDFIDERYESADYGLWALAPKYVLGQGWNGVGFSANEALQFVSNSQTRPTTFCGISLGNVGTTGQEGTVEYNQAWSKYLYALQEYLRANNMLEKSYYYTMNEPQNDVDYALAAKLCQISKAAAPDLKIAISRQPLPQMYNVCPYDIWISYVGLYNRSASWDRLLNHNEENWIYSLEQDAAPYPNPTQIINGAVHARIIPWISWIERVSGYAYYAVSDPTLGGWFYNRNISLRAEMFREGFEDYEYLLLANNNQFPAPYSNCSVDNTVIGVAQSLTSWLASPESLSFLKAQIGFYISNQTSSLPILVIPNPTPPKSWFISFQDPSGEPLESPLVVNNHTWIKVGWPAYDAGVGYGWTGRNIGNSGIMLYGYSTYVYDEFNEVEKGYVYDDYGGENVFTVDLGNGKYDVSVGVGRPGRGSGDGNNVKVNGIKVVDNVVLTSSNSVYVGKIEVVVSNGKMVFNVGGSNQYTFLSYIMIIPK